MPAVDPDRALSPARRAFLVRRSRYAKSRTTPPPFSTSSRQRPRTNPRRIGRRTRCRERADRPNAARCPSRSRPRTRPRGARGGVASTVGLHELVDRPNGRSMVSRRSDRRLPNTHCIEIAVEQPQQLHWRIQRQRFCQHLVGADTTNSARLILNHHWGPLRLDARHVPPRAWGALCCRGFRLSGQSLPMSALVVVMHSQARAYYRCSSNPVTGRRPAGAVVGKSDFLPSAERGTYVGGNAERFLGLR